MFIRIKCFSKQPIAKKVSREVSAYLEYTGNNTWEGHISGQGVSNLQTKLINVGKGVKVVCNYQDKVLFAIGNVAMSDTGSVPKYTTKKVYKPDDSIFTLKQGLVGVAALWHDLGKANSYFQRKLRGECNPSDPVRHEWVSGVIVSTFAKGNDWLSDDFIIPEVKHSDNVFGDDQVLNAVLWLINTHHKKGLVEDPIYRATKTMFTETLQCVNVNGGWFNYGDNIDECYKIDTSFITDTYVKQLNRYRKKLLATKHIWFTLGEDQKIAILQECRVALMLGDSNFSSDLIGGDGSHLYANLDECGNLKQTLTQHLLGVTDCALKALFTINHHKPVKANFIPTIAEKGEGKFAWQNGVNMVDSSIDNMFCINMASTGKGKTLANLKLLQHFGNVRCSFGLGMVSLTKQTAKQFLDMGVDYNSAAMVTGFSKSRFNLGSESLDQDEVSVEYWGQTSSLSKVFPNNNAGFKNKKLLSAPILVTTTDHLVKASGVKKGNKQMLPYVRCMHSDLVLDEIDDYGIEDMVVLARLVYLTACYGNKVIISSATITPAISNIFYEAYSSGYKVFCANKQTTYKGVNVVWWDEFGIKVEKVTDQFSNLNTRFVNKRITNLLESTPKHKALVVDQDDNMEAVKQSITTLHNAHNSGGVSFGLIRTTTIKDCVAVTQELQNWETDLSIKILCYHSRFVGDTKAQMEEYLSKVLNRKGDEYKKFVDTTTPTAYIVVATPVVEVGRDFDFDWAIIEPSSERSIVQCAGRVLRHRSSTPTTHNIHILKYPFKFYRNSNICYDVAGYESKGYKLKSKNMLDIYKKESIVNSVNRLQGDAAFYTKSLTALEHKVLLDKLTTDIADTNVFVGGWQLTANPHEYCKWRRGTKNEDLVLTDGKWSGNVTTTKPIQSKIWRKWQGENGSITVPEYLLDKTICYNDFYGGYENE
ncbi:CRISPR-associated helicase [Vibrio phage JSF13]|jgi:CRISPR-associated endonuclease/helicase Cas3|uniref:HD Cas3-type domain-containing protein n=4 Tax=Vibrio phage ICP1_2004_A TaxID=979527 RepID=UPI0002B7E7F4|nr:Cas3 [Vibrio phage ICP1_2011_A]ASV42300.1 CRISPR-associated helicase [Vibrio phage JSF13]ASV42354.1 CRISPR-associated helicase [Vibrio phage JSF14]ASV42569.1 CRISPR-associated helicase [Vibrio phage JSF17]AXY82403.1 Cas3 [Vibrio phage ICP1_2011_B]QFR59149.1 Cas3 [Vibrio phage ICP1_2017_F_Mathbaria]QVV99305.1 type I-F CRISPR-associated protein [Vibrio phage ICP1]HAS3707688.1 hypothetical protein [Vibrio cholerae]